MTELEIQIASIDNQIEALKTKRIELLNKLPKTNPKELFKSMLNTLLLSKNGANKN